MPLDDDEILLDIQSLSLDESQQILVEKVAAIFAAGLLFIAGISEIMKDQRLESLKKHLEKSNHG